MQKRIVNILFYLLGVFLLFVSCSESRVVEPDKCGDHLISVLKEFDPNNKEDFSNRFMSLETINQIGQDETLIKNKKRRQRFLNMTEAERTKQIIDPAFDIVENEGEAYSISWKEIKYVGFVFEPQTYANLTSIKGKLVFEFKKKKYDVGVVDRKSVV